MEYNIFKSKSPIKRELEQIYYNLLTNRTPVTYEMVFLEYQRLEKRRVKEQQDTPSDIEDIIEKEVQEEYNKSGYNMNKSVYDTLKKIIPNFNKEMNLMGYSIIADYNVKNTSFTLVTKYADPLQLITKEAKYNRLAEKISDNILVQRPILVKYKPFNKKEMKLIFHPHLLKNYMGKWYAFGISELKGHSPKSMVLAINRINMITALPKNFEYIPSKPNEYDYMRDIIGIYHENHSKTKIVLKALDKNTHGKLEANPLHNSQRTIEDSQDDYGYIELTVIPNGELRAAILSYGSKLKVVEPLYLKEEIKKEIKEMSELY